MEERLRDRILKDIVEIHICEYTCATMSDSYGVVLAGQKEASEWAIKKLKEYGFKKQEVEKQLERCYQEAKEKGRACCYSLETEQLEV